MEFDVIITNPPYQKNDKGFGRSATPLYDKFIQQAKKLNPKYLIMIIPARWYSQGKGLDKFRDEMLNDKHLKELHDYKNAKECFPDLDFSGGICYFLWDKEYWGDCNIYNHMNGKIVSFVKRPLLEPGANVFIRYNEAISIFKKVRIQNEKVFSSIVSVSDPFGMAIRFPGSYKRMKLNIKFEKTENSIDCYYYGWRIKGKGYVTKNEISRNLNWIHDYKILVPRAWGRDNLYKDKLNPFLVEPNSCCTETYLIIGPFKEKKKAENVIKYIQTKFFHFLILSIKNSQNATRKTYNFIPLQDFTKVWTDEMLYKKYNLNEKEIAFIEHTIRSMN